MHDDDQDPTRAGETPVPDEPSAGHTTPLIVRVERAKQQHPRPLSGRDEPVDHEREPGVPPPATDDYDDMVDVEGAESFPASDPPSNY
jgi:hypothetical protein